MGQYQAMEHQRIRSRRRYHIEHTNYVVNQTLTRKMYVHTQIVMKLMYSTHKY